MNRFDRPKVVTRPGGPGDRHAMWQVVSETMAAVTLRDVGPWERYQSITNDAEWVVNICYQQGLGNRLLLYYDTEGTLGGLAHDKGVFKGFYPVPEDAIPEDIRLDNLILED